MSRTKIGRRKGRRREPRSIKLDIIESSQLWNLKKSSYLEWQKQIRDFSETRSSWQLKELN